MVFYTLTKTSNFEEVNTKFTIPKKSFNEIKANGFQATAILMLQEHVFGSVENYKLFRESGEDFPEYYRKFKNFILLCDEEGYTTDWFIELIKLCPRITNISN